MGGEKWEEGEINEERGREMRRRGREIEGGRERNRKRESVGRGREKW